MNYEEAHRVLQAEKQVHLLKFWDSLSPAEQAALLKDIEAVDWALLQQVLPKPAAATAEFSASDCALPPVVTLPASRDEFAAQREASQTGEQLLRDNGVAALTVAGGQGTRLGFAGPKGMFPITPVKKKSLFEHFAESISASNRKFDCDILWLLMTSPDNHSETVMFFEQNDFFGLSNSRVRFFRQGIMPSLSPGGKVLLLEQHRLALSPDGHGGMFRALHNSGLLDEMRSENVRYISHFQVDNPLITPLDPTFIGLAHQNGSEVGSKVVRKAYDDERVGVFVNVAGTTRVVEYTVLPEHIARRRNPDGSRTFDFANIAAHVFDVEFIRKLTAKRENFRMPWYFAHKKVPYIDLDTGRQVQSDTPNADKLEQFIFDAIPLAKNPVQYEVHRYDEFSPVKNAVGSDSPETARNDLVAKATRWLEQCGVEIPSIDPGKRPLVEISPLFALDVDELRVRLDSFPPLDTRRPIYLGP